MFVHNYLSTDNLMHRNFWHRKTCKAD